MRKDTSFTYTILGLTLAGLILTQTPVWAGVYKWQDDQGKIHFTNDKSSIPLQYLTKKQVKIVIGSEPSFKKKAEQVELASIPAITDPEMPKQPGPSVVQEEGGKSPEMAPEAVAMLKETKTYLEKENRAHLRLIHIVEPTEANGKHFIMSGKNALPRKKELVKKLDAFKLPSLKDARKYLKRSAFKDRLEKIGGNDYLVRIQKLVERMKKGIKTKEKIIKNIEADLNPVS